jgi:aerobic-type carbon monoxide dehydrogenase small subunit (CoxS/CutS family)
VSDPAAAAIAPVGVELTVNGQARSATVETRRSLADLLRYDLGLTGTHLGCEHGVCGACTVLVDGEPVRSCLMLAVQARHCEVTTVEGLGSLQSLHPLQQAMWDSHSFQCGFCTPGFLMAAVALLAENPAPTEAEIREALSGNLCRCTGYQSIVDGVTLGAAGLRGESDASPPADHRGHH